KKAGRLRCKSVVLHIHFAPIDSVMPRSLLGYESAIEKLQQVLIKGVHTFIEGGFDVAGEEMQIIPRDRLLRAGVAFHNLQTRNALFERGRKEALAVSDRSAPPSNLYMGSACSTPHSSARPRRSPLASPALQRAT